MSKYVTGRDLVERAKLAMPISVTYLDPFTEEPITLARENLYTLLAIDTNDIVLEGQILPVLYAEMGRFQRAAEFAAARAERDFRKWKAARGEEFRAKIAKGPVKKTATGKTATRQTPTVTETEAFYRSHKDYDSFHDEPEKLNAQSKIFEDLKKSFGIKARIAEEQSRTVRGYEGVERSVQASEGRLNDYKTLVDDAANAVEQDGSADALSRLSGKQPRALD